MTRADSNVVIAGLEEDRVTFWLPRRNGLVVEQPCLLPTDPKRVTIRLYSNSPTVPASHPFFGT